LNLNYCQEVEQVRAVAAKICRCPDLNSYLGHYSEAAAHLEFVEMEKGSSSLED